MEIERMIELLYAEVTRHQSLALVAENLKIFHDHMEVSEALMLAISIAKGRL
ncbi:MAG: hypothetical protein J6J04_01165 [Oscillospiraceae bacterium]|nr:hypothetical protein [Oscillospiraceae bacterium]